MKKLLIILGIMAFASCKPEVYTGPLDSPLGNWKEVTSKYFFDGEYVHEASGCTYRAISFYKDSLCCIAGVKGTFRWTYDAGKLIVDSTIWNVPQMTGRMLVLEYIERILPSENNSTDTVADGSDSAAETEGNVEENDNEKPEETIPSEPVTTEYNGKTVFSQGDTHWYINSSGESVPCWPVSGTTEDGTVSTICWWDTRSDTYRSF